MAYTGLISPGSGGGFTSTQNMIQTLKALARAAAVSNPLINGFGVAGCTVAWANSGSVATQQWNLATSPSAFQYAGGGQANLSGTIYAASGYLLGGGGLSALFPQPSPYYNYTPNTWSVRFMTSAPYFEMHGPAIYGGVTGSTIHVKINGVYATPAGGLIPNPVSGGFMTVAFAGGRAPRLIEISCGGTFGFRGIYINSGGSPPGIDDVYAPFSAASAPLIVYDGDSMTAESGLANADCGFTATIVGTALTVVSPTWGTLAVGKQIVTGAPGAFTLVTGGTAPNFTVTPSQTVSTTTAMTAGPCVDADAMWYTQEALALGWNNVTSVAVSSTGFLSVGNPPPGNGTLATLRQRIPFWLLPYAPAVIRVAGGYNDITWGPWQYSYVTQAQIVTEIGLYIAALQAAYPNALKIIQGPFAGKRGPDAYTIGLDNAMGALIAGIGDPMTKFISVNVPTDGPEPLNYGTGYVNATNLTGLSDWVTSSDGTHPGVLGNAHYGARSAARVRALIESL